MWIAAHNDATVAARQQSAMGTISSHEPQNHNRYGYRFRVEATYYSGWETPLKAEPKIGQSVKVYFDSQNPAENSLTDFAELAAAWRGRAIVLFIMCAAFASAVLALDHRAKSRSSNSPANLRSAP